MMMPPSDGTLLSIAVASGKIGYVFLIDGELCKWRVVTKASRSTEAAVAKVRAWIKFYEPDTVVLEQLTGQTRKSGQTIKNIQAIQEAVQAASCDVVLVERQSQFSNKYDEISSLAEKYPNARTWTVLPRKLWEAEHKHTVIWEALSLVDQLKG